MFLDHIPHLNYIWLVVASTIAGVMNAMAGGGSFLSFPAMLGMGVLPVQANATNTVALWPGQVTSVATLRGDVRRDLLPAVAITSVLGGVCGAEVLLHTAQRTFLHLIPWLILVGTVPTAYALNHAVTPAETADFLASSGYRPLLRTEHFTVWVIGPHGWKHGPELLSQGRYDINGWLPAATHGWYSSMQEFGNAKSNFLRGAT